MEKDKNAKNTTDENAEYHNKLRRIKDIFTRFYKENAKNKNETSENRWKRRMHLLSLLFFPYLVITGLCMLSRWQDFKSIDPWYLGCIFFASTWFIFGPFLVQNYIQEIMQFKRKSSTDHKNTAENASENESRLPDNVYLYFERHSEKFLTFFIRYRLFGTLLFVIAGVVPILFHPFIISQNMLGGHHDWLFWLILLFIFWFVSYCMNAIAFMLLLSFHILPDLCRDAIIHYNPLLEDHRYALKQIRGICGKTVRYTCSGLVLIPLALYYFYQKPDSISNARLGNELSAAEQHLIYIKWIVAMLLLYSLFLFFFLTYQNMQIQSYSKSKGNACLARAQIDFINEGQKEKLQQPCGTLSASASRYTEYLRLQEIKLLCKTSATLDINTVLTYISILVSILSAIQGIQKIIEWSPP